MRLVRLNENNEILYFNMFNIYLYEMSQYNKYIIGSINTNGVFYEEITTQYYAQNGFETFLLFEKELPAGLLVVSKRSGDTIYQHEINELFLLPPYRKGKYSYTLILSYINNNPGVYRVLVLKKNIRAQKFWLNIIDGLNAEYKKTNYNDILDEIYFNASRWQCHLDENFA